MPSPGCSYPGLADHPDHELAKTLLPRARARSSASASRAAATPAATFIEALQLFSHLANVGDAKSLVIHPASTTHQQMDAQASSMPRRRRGPDPAVGRARGSGRHHRRPRPGAARLAEGLTWNSPSTASRLSPPPAAGELDRDLPLIVLLHGAGMDHTVWALQTRYLAHHGRSVLAVDLPGHGRSGGRASARPSRRWPTGPRLLDAAGFQRRRWSGIRWERDRAGGRDASSGHRLRAAPGRHRGEDARASRPDPGGGGPTIMPRRPDLDWGLGRPRPFGGIAARYVDARRQPRPPTGTPGVLAGDLTACDAYHGRRRRRRADTSPGSRSFSANAT